MLCTGRWCGLLLLLLAACAGDGSATLLVSPTLPLLPLAWGTGALGAALAPPCLLAA